MRLFVRSVASLMVLLPTGWSVAQWDPDPIFPAPQAQTITPLPESIAEPPSEPWSPPAQAGAAPVGELPLPGTGDPAATPTADPATQAIVEDAAKSWHMPRGWFGPSPWDTGVELGINGSSGTSDSFSIRTGAYIKRESRFSKFDFDTSYNLTTGDGETTQNNAKLDLTNDWLLSDKSPWTLFGKANVFYDAFATFDIQTNLNTGIGYRWIHTPERELMTRVGAGAQREFGGDENEWTPESLLGLEFSRRVTKTQKYYGKLEYFPELEQFGEFRAVADVGWEIQLSQPSNLSLKLSASDRYDSTPDGVSPHLLNYSILLLLKM